MTPEKFRMTPEKPRMTLSGKIKQSANAKILTFCHTDKLVKEDIISIKMYNFGIINSAIL